MGNVNAAVNGVFSRDDAKSRVVVILADGLENISALDIQTLLHNNGYRVRSVHARPYHELPADFMNRGA